MNFAIFIPLNYVTKKCCKSIQNRRLQPRFLLFKIMLIDILKTSGISGMNILYLFGSRLESIKIFLFIVGNNYSFIVIYLLYPPGFRRFDMPLHPNINKVFNQALFVSVSEFENCLFMGIMAFHSSDVDKFDETTHSQYDACSDILFCQLRSQLWRVCLSVVWTQMMVNSNISSDGIKFPRKQSNSYLYIVKVFIVISYISDLH